MFLRDFWQSWLKAGEDGDFCQFQTGDTFGTALDISADVTGYSSGNGAWFAQHIEMNEGTGDKESKISFKMVSYPGSQSTQPFGMNDSRDLAGSYFDSAGNRHGFTAQPTF